MEPTIAPLLPRRRSWPVKKFVGSERPATWDGLHKDPELWFDDADCIVHFYAPGASRRGPSLRIPLSYIEALQSPYLDRCLRIRESPTPDTDSLHSSSNDSDHSDPSTISDSVIYELYLPAPASVPRGQAYAYHLTTRNCFAVVADLPIVGERLSSALINLWGRLQEWQADGVSFESFTGQYCRSQRYTDMAEHPDNALACLIFAEHVRSKQLWIDAFAHCVGMQSRLYGCSEFDALSDSSAILITKASLEMTIHIPRITRAVGSFLEEELGSEHIGLSKPARNHLDRFRSCLSNFYIECFGYFPPAETSTFNKRVWSKMYYSFRMLYQYLVDEKSSPNKISAHGMNGGMCVVQNAQAFDRRHGFAPLPHPLPLLPETSAKSTRRRTLDASKSLVSWRSFFNDPDFELKLALEKASNSDDGEVMACPLVQEYQRFERLKLEEKLNIAEARKVRWLLIYGILQMLTSIVCAPKEVRDADSPSYPMCVLTTGCPPWNEGEARKKPQAMIVDELLDIDGSVRGSVDQVSIHPDCEEGGVQAFFESRSCSEIRGLDLARTDSRRLSRADSIRNSVSSSVSMLQRTVAGSLSRRNTPRWNAAQLRLKRPVSAFCEITVPEYSNGNDVPVHQDPLEKFDFDLATETKSGTPPLDRSSSQSSQASNSTTTAASGTGTPTSDRSSYSSNSVKSCEEYSPVTDVSTDSWNDKSLTHSALPLRPVQSYHPSKHLCQINRDVTAGCYQPTGLVEEALEEADIPHLPNTRPFDFAFQHQRSMSDASSHYSDDDVLATPDEAPVSIKQAAEIEEEEFRGRRRSRGLDRLTKAEMAAAGKQICYSSTTQTTVTVWH